MTAIPTTTTTTNNNNVFIPAIAHYEPRIENDQKVSTDSFIMQISQI